MAATNQMTYLESVSKDLGDEANVSLRYVQTAIVFDTSDAITGIHCFDVSTSPIFQQAKKNKHINFRKL